MRSMVLQPTEPVLPSTVTLRLWPEPAMSAPRDDAAAADEAQERHRRDDREHAVEPIEQPAMAGNEPARILDAEMALGNRFGEIARLRDDGERAAQERQSRKHRHVHQRGGRGSR